jgi:hypothetical protein
LAIFFAITLFVSATLLFLVQPMIARMLLPKLGGTPQVWNTCMVFFQSALLAGYGYAHLSTRWLGTRRSAWLHLALLVLPLLLWYWMPFGVPAAWEPAASDSPVLWLLTALVVTAGLPFFVVATTAPLLQRWFADTDHPAGHDPYFLYAASNVGSMLALFGYPSLVEPMLTLQEQSWYWGVGYAALAVLIGGCAVVLWQSGRAVGWAESSMPTKAVASSEDSAHPTKSPALQRLLWTALAFVPSSLLLGVTTYLTTDIAAFPWLWVLPLALYLFTFIIAFSSVGPRVQPVAELLAPPVVLLFIFQYVTGYTQVSDNPGLQTVILIAYHLGTFFVLALVCHGRLAASRPAASHLTEFYLWMSFGGMLGGLFNALVAPFLFTSALEYPLALVGVCLLYRPFSRRTPEARKTPRDSAEVEGLPALAVDLAWGAGVGLVTLGLLRFAWPAREFTSALSHRVHHSLLVLGPLLLCYALALSHRPLRFGLAVAAVMIVFLRSADERGLAYRGRSFFGIVAVYETEIKGGRFVRFLHGTTLHGMQSRNPEERTLPMTYFHPDGPMGDIMRVWHTKTGPQALGVTGLGAGTLACYARTGDEVTFYEIDPLVERVARDTRWFTYLSDAEERGVRINVVLGDGRMRIREAPAGKYSMIILDAFSSDAVPVHLLTKEALAIYREKLPKGGLIVFNISNRHLDLQPVLYHLARDAKLVGRYCWDAVEDEKGPYRFSSGWVVLAEHTEDLGEISTIERWKELKDKPGTSLWTDNFSNLFRVVNW